MTMLGRMGAAAQQGRRRVMGAGAPVNTSPPSISGTVAHGSVLTATPGTWTGSPSITGQWYAGASPISGETGTTYTVDRADGIMGADFVRYVETDSVSATSADSNDLVYTGADLPLAGFSLDEDVTVVSGGVDSIAASYGSIAATLTAMSSTQRPAYDATGGVSGRPRMLPDGVDDVVKGVITLASGSFSDFEMGIVGQRDTFAASGDVWIQYETLAAAALLFAMRDLSATQFRLTSNVDLNSAADPDGVLAHYSGEAITGTYSIRKNGTIDATSAGAFTTRNSGEVFAVGGRSAVSAYADLDIRATYIARKLTTDQRADHQALLTRRTGV